MKQPRELKNVVNNNDTQCETYESEVLKGIIEKLNKHKTTKEVEELLRTINDMLDGKKVDLGSLRTQLLNIYNGETTYGDYYGSQFYDAIFSLLLLLAKYNPIEKRCPIMLSEVSSDDRLLTINGRHYDRSSLEKNLGYSNINPVTHKPFSKRELDYLDAHIKDQNNPEIPPVENDQQFKDQNNPEIPPVENDQQFARPSFGKRFLNKYREYKQRHPWSMTDVRHSRFVGIILGVCIWFALVLGTVSIIMATGWALAITLGSAVVFISIGAALGVLGGWLAHSTRAAYHAFTNANQLPITPELYTGGEKPSIEPEKSNLLFLLDIIKTPADQPSPAAIIEPVEQEVKEDKNECALSSTGQVHNSLPQFSALTQPLLSENRATTTRQLLPRIQVDFLNRVESQPRADAAAAKEAKVQMKQMCI